MEEVLKFINTAIRAEKGNKVTIDSTLRDAELDSLSYVSVILSIENKYEIELSEYGVLNIRDIVSKVL